MTSGLALFTSIHVALSLIGIASGVVVAQGLLKSKRRDGWTLTFLVTTLATSVTGYGFPVDHVLPSHIVGGVSIVVLALAIVARYTYRLVGRSRVVYVIGAVVGLYLNVFVLIAQLFLKVPALEALAPTESEPPFAAAQLVNLVCFVILGIAAAKKFRPLAAALVGGLEATPQG
jgi:hypothetical protein